MGRCNLISHQNNANLMFISSYQYTIIFTQTSWFIYYVHILYCVLFK